MGSEEKRERKVAFRYKPYRTGQRKTSVRKLESFEVVREQFESLAMPNQEEVVQSSPKNVSPEVGDISQPGDDEAFSHVVDATVVEQMKAAIEKILIDRQKPLRILKEFSKRSSVSRQALAGVANKVNLRHCRPNIYDTL